MIGFSRQADYEEVGLANMLTIYNLTIEKPAREKQTNGKFANKIGRQ